MNRYARALEILGLAALILLIAVLHTRVYDSRNYREDEINSVHAARLMSPPQIVQWMAGDVHPPGWRLFADFWVDAFGPSEAATRWSSQLINLLSFALLYQLGRQLRDRRTGFYAVALLGVYAFASNGMYEFRPYAALVALVTALHLVYCRWLTKPQPRQMVLYVALGIAAIYTHFFTLFVFAAQALVLALFHRFQRKKYLDSIFMWCGIALAFSVWMLPLFAVMRGPFGGGYYNQSLESLYAQAHFVPEAIFLFLLLMSPFAPRLLPENLPPAHLRWREHWQVLYPAALLIGAIGCAFLVDQFYGVLNARGLQSVVMLIALLMALGLRALPSRAAVVLLLLLYIHAPRHIAIQPSNAPYREIVAAMQSTYESDSALITEFDWAWRWLLPAAYFLMDFTPDEMHKSRMFHLIEKPDRAHPPTYPDALVNVYRGFDADSLMADLPAHEQLWLLRQGGGNGWGDPLQAWLRSHYARLRRHQWDAPYPTTYELSEYRRAPESSRPILVGDDLMRLHHWTLLDSVDAEPCQRITIESWWQMTRADETPITLLIILADSDGDGQKAISESVPADVFTTEWIPAAFYRDRSALSVPCDIRPGSYPLLLGLKQSMSGQSLPLRYAAGGDIGDLFYLTTLHINQSD